MYANLASLGVAHSFASFSSADNVTLMELSSPEGSTSGAAYVFYGTELTKAEWESKTKPFFDRSSDLAAIGWQDRTLSRDSEC